MWAVIIKLISFEFGGMAWAGRARFLVAGVVNAVLLVVSWLLVAVFGRLAA